MFEWIDNLKMIEEIILKFKKPKKKWNKGFSTKLIKLLSSSNNITNRHRKSLLFSEENLFPKTRVLFGGKTTSVSFKAKKERSKSYKTKGLTFGINLNEEKDIRISEKEVEIKVLEDRIGKYSEVTLGSRKYYQLSLSQLLSRFEGKIKEINHLGFNFSPDEVSSSRYNEFKGCLSRGLYLARYPTGEEWPFVIPCTKEEFISGVSDLSREGIQSLKWFVQNIMLRLSFNLMSK